MTWWRHMDLKYLIGHRWYRWCLTMCLSPSHYLNTNSSIQCATYWNIMFMKHSTHELNINTLRPRQNGRRFLDDIFKCIFLNENIWISIKISLRFVLKGPINNIPALVQIMAWRRPGASHYLNQWWLDYRRIYESLGLNELKPCLSMNILNRSLPPEKCLLGL